MSDAAPALPHRTMLRAFLRSDPAFDGLFWTAVRTTGIFCRPSCPARKPRPEHCAFFASVREALRAGFRPCRRCHPLDAGPALPNWFGRLLDELEAAPRRPLPARALRARGLDPARVRRHFRARFGMTFAAFCRARRLGASIESLRAGQPLDRVIVESGYESHSGFRDAFGRAFGRAPGRSRGLEPVTTAMIDTPLGPMVAGVRGGRLCLLEFADRRGLPAQLETLRRRLRAPLLPGSDPLLARAAAELGEYFAGRRREFALPLEAPGTPFQARIWEELRRIPFGATLSYEELARRAGRPGAVRAAGTANGANRIAIVIPCHRVVRKDGAPGGYGGGLARKLALLALERGVAGDAEEAARTSQAPAAAEPPPGAATPRTSRGRARGRGGPIRPPASVARRR